MKVTLNENCRRLEGYPGNIWAVVGHLLFVKVEGIAQSMTLTPGHVVEEEAVCERYGLTPVDS